MFVIDVAFATVGYLLTMSPLDAHIRTANPHAAAWVAALICYPPFILMSDGGPLDYHPGTPGGLVDVAGGSSGAAVAIGRGAGLPDRDLCLGDGGVRLALFQPDLPRRADERAVCLLAPPCLSVEEPVLVAVAILPFWSAITGRCGAHDLLLAAVSGIYYWRAKTEEGHLGEDPKYREYRAGWSARERGWVPYPTVPARGWRAVTARPQACSRAV